MDTRSLALNREKRRQRHTQKEKTEGGRNRETLKPVPQQLNWDMNQNTEF